MRSMPKLIFGAPVLASAGISTSPTTSNAMPFPRNALRAFETIGRCWRTLSSPRLEPRRLRQSSAGISSRCTSVHGNRFAPVSEHVRTALEFYSKKPQPDYRNSIKESISAVESAAKIITKLSTATLDEAIKVIDQTHSLHGSFKTGILKLYGYASDEGGIRHSLTEATNIDEADARYMLVSCSAFANYLISSYDKQP